MGTTLTGTTPQDTYDSLIKVTDNGPLSGSLKVLTDGLGNNSALSLSTGAASVTGTLAVSGTSTFNSGQNVIYASFDNDAALFQRVGAYGAVIRLGRSGVTNSTTIDYPTDATFAVSTAASERLRVTAAGNVGIGTSGPVLRLDVKGAAADTTTVGGITVEQSTIFRPSNDAGGLRFGFDASSNAYIYSSASGGILNLGTRTAPNNNINVSVTANGLTFNGDTAAANALDDYEEGTWTMGVAFGGASVGVTTSSNTGTYTKIGRQVTVNGLILLTSKGSSTGSATITGLPFSIANNNANYSALSLRIDKITFVNQFQAYGDINTTSISLEEITILGVRTALTDADFANDSSIIVSFTYFV